MTLTRKTVGWLLVAHGIICALGAFFPFYPPVFFFYWFVKLPFAVNLVLVLLFGVFQIVGGAYLAFAERLRRIRLYWLALMIVIIVLLLLVYPALNYFFGL
ncbi:MAG TPA: hypothetical protein G4O12_08240 [Dehalococcoidia bacterium]|nr:hypothetical protein [Dehalococcoidia bacterium]